MPYGRVVEKKQGVAVIEMQRQDMCGSCHACEMMSGKKACTLSCKDDIGTQSGDWVEVNLETNRFLRATYTMYGIPLIGFILGLTLGWVISDFLGMPGEDLWMIGGAFVGIGSGLLVIRYKEKRRRYEHFLPSIVKVMNEEAKISSHENK